MFTVVYREDYWENKEIDEDAQFQLNSQSYIVKESHLWSNITIPTSP